MSEKIAIIGLGYVGLPLLIGLARVFDDVVGFDIDAERIQELQSGDDWTGETTESNVRATSARLTTDPAALVDRSFFIVTVPTPIDSSKRPDLRPLYGACKTIGEALKAAERPDTPPLIVFESTVYPGLTEETCGAKLADYSELKPGADFKLGYSPERINPGDHQNRLETIVKIISASDGESLGRMEAVYGKVIDAGLHRAPSIRVAEAAKVLENTQRDLNVALMNELALICDRLGIRTRDVLDAAGTKWNFLKFTPGLVGGHCIGVDPYYLTTRAEELGYNPQVILAGRRINDTMSSFIAHKIVKLMVEEEGLQPGRRVGILGLTFKENVRDLRNSRVPEIVDELHNFGIHVIVHDPMACPIQARHEYAVAVQGREALTDLDALILAVPHDSVVDMLPDILPAIRPQGWLIDIKSVVDPKTLPPQLQYWSL